jgi:phosphatidate phosphatase APP1
MVKLNKGIKKIIRKTRWPWVKLKIYIKRRLGWLGHPIIYPYAGFCNGKEIYVSGSVIEDRGLSKPHEGQSIRSNILAMIKRYTGDEFAGVRLRVEFRSQTKEMETNEEGFFSCRFQLSGPIEEEVFWTQASYELLENIDEHMPTIQTVGDVLVIGKKPQFIIISDVDDTFLVSHSTQTFKKIRLMLFKNALTRSPFPGVVAFYKALQKGTADSDFNPIFYVSSSERNLYDLLIDFCDFRDIPKGPFLLRDMQKSLYDLITAGGGNHLHKLEKIRELVNFFPEISFVLIGDSGQRDPEIYQKAVSEFPGRIKTIYIRCIGSEKKQKQVDEIVRDTQLLGTPMIVVKNTEEASEHAVNNGLIRGEEKALVKEEKEKDETDQS